MFVKIKTIKIFSNPWLYAITLLGVMLAAYGYQITRLGFFWDDWQAVFLSRYHQPSIWWNFFLGDRPISAWTYLVTTPLLGMHPLVWHLFTLLIRWAGVLAFCWALQGIWLRRSWEIRWMGLLLAVFPGFSQQSISVAYSQHFITMALFSVSLGCMTWSTRKPDRYWALLITGAAASLLSLLTMEYWMGLELLRPLFLWFILKAGNDRSTSIFSRVFRFWSPYLLVLILSLFWRFFIYTRYLNPAPANNPYLLAQLLVSPLPTLIHLAQIILQDFIHIVLFVWANILLPLSINLNIKMTLVSWVVGAVVAAVLAWLSCRQPEVEQAKPDEAENDSFEKQSVLAGLAGILFGGLPVWLTDHQVIVGLWSDRFLLAPMFGSVILVVWFLTWIGSYRRRKAILLGLLVGLAVAFQIQVVNRYYLNSELQREFTWQLHWRVPGLKPGTAVVSPDIPFSLVSTESMGFLVNTMYYNKPDSTSVPYWFLDVLRYKGSEIIKELKDGEPIRYELRNIIFEGSTTDALGIAFNGSRGCLRVLDPVYLTAPLLVERESEVYPISHPERIQISDLGGNPPLPADIFDMEPKKGWCYFYEKADLARQQKDWDKVQNLGTEAEKQGLSPKNGAEYLPFIEASAHTGDWEKARQLTINGMMLSDKLKPFMCSTWRRMAEEIEITAGSELVIRNTMEDLKCAKP